MRVAEIAGLAVVALALDVALLAGGRFAVGGYGLAIAFVALPVAMVVVARARRPSVRLGAIGVLLAAVAGRCAFDPTPATVLGGIGLVFGLALALRARRAFVPDVLVNMLTACATAPSRVAALVKGVSKITARTRVGKLGKAHLAPVAIPVALCLVFLGVFALANPVVARGVSAAWSGLASIVGVPSFSRVFLWVAATVASVVMFRPSVAFLRHTEAATREGEASPTSLLVARNSLAALNVLFFGYNALDAAYLWSGSPPTGTTTQHYAHQGAFWLTVALVMVTAVVGVMFRGPLAHDVLAKTARKLSYVWMGQGVVLALGTYRRIAIHVGHSGLSDLRIVGILGTTLVLSGLALVALKLHRGRTLTWLARRQLDAFAFAAVLYAVFPTHWVSAKVNVARIESGEYRPVLHMFRQSQKAESAAALLPLLEHRDLRVRQGVAALLEAERTELANEAATEGSWRQRDIAGGRALTALDAKKDAIASILGPVDRAGARRTLLEISRVANEDRSLEEILAVPAADNPGASENAGGRYVQ